MPPINIPISLYIHIPWCVRKCPYCDFNSHNKPEILPFKEYFAHLLQDFLAYKHLLQGRQIYSIFIGGGTPSLAAPSYYAWLFTELQKYCTFRHNIEITMELNPGTHEYHNVLEYFDAGINRLSIGAQSFNNQSLQDLGRIHNRDNTFEVVSKLKNRNFNLDLMHSLPNQSIDQALEDLKIAINLQPTHISWYQLTIEENTYFAKHRPILPSDKTSFAIHQQGLELLQANGYQHYEISAFAKDKNFCKHNLNYWQYGDYLGIGCGAHSKITKDNFQIIRLAKIKNPQKFMNIENGAYALKEEIVTPDNLPFEFFMNAARLIDGFSLKLFTERTNLPITTITSKLKLAQTKQLITIEDDAVKLTPYGKLFVNDLIEIFL